MKKTYSVYAIGFALVLASGVLLTRPPTTVLAASCTAKCQYGSDVHVEGSTCSCTDNTGCTWTESGHSYTQECAKKNSDDVAPEEGGN